MNYGFILTGDPRFVVELAQEAEVAGWDGVFLPDDWTAAWIKLTAIAMCTRTLLLGTMLTPLPEQFPWYVAAQTATLDQLARGRVILTAGLGVLELDKFGMQENRLRAQRLDEALEIIDRWWRGEPLRSFVYNGQYYHLQEMNAEVDWPTHTPTQQPRIPIWVIGGPKRSQILRASRWDGAVVNGSPEELRARKGAISALRTNPATLDFIVEGETPSDDTQRASAQVQPYVEAGATWWLESRWGDNVRPDDIRARVRSGPPRVS